MVDLAINPPGTHSDYLVTSFDGDAYALPEQGADFSVRLRGRVPNRYDVGGMNETRQVGRDEEGVVTVHRIRVDLSKNWSGGAVRFEGYVDGPSGALHADGFLAFGGLATPPGILAIFNYEWLSAENRRQLAEAPLPPLGTLRMW
jgi:hypothetical protein